MFELLKNYVVNPLNFGYILLEISNQNVQQNSDFDVFKEFQLLKANLINEKTH